MQRWVWTGPSLLSSLLMRRLRHKLTQAHQGNPILTSRTSMQAWSSKSRKQFNPTDSTKQSPHSYPTRDMRMQHSSGSNTYHKLASNQAPPRRAELKQNPTVFYCKRAGRHEAGHVPLQGSAKQHTQQQQCFNSSTTLLQQRETMPCCDHSVLIMMCSSHDGSSGGPTGVPAPAATT